MRESDLPSPNIGARGYHLRRISAQAISQLQVVSPAYGGAHPNAADLSAFFAACKAEADAMLQVAPTLAFTPTAKTYSIADGADQAGPALSTGGSTGTVTYSSSDPTKATVDPATGKVTPVAAGTSTITASVAAAGKYKAATKTYVATITA